MITIRRLIWDSWNVAHLARHDVTSDEVEQVCHGDPLVQQGHTGRVVLVGPSDSGRMLEVVLDAEGSAVYYVVTAHPASKKDRALYDKEKGGDK